MVKFGSKTANAYGYLTIYITSNKYMGKDIIMMLINQMPEVIHKLINHYVYATS